jgi:tripartite-type tricarboxylate transporter receptor subunit TctC
MHHPTLPRRALLAAGLAMPALRPAQGQAEWPTQTVRFIGLFPPGGGTDIISRLWCAKMAEITGQQFVIENRSGTGGNIACCARRACKWGQGLGGRRGR